MHTAIRPIVVLSLLSAAVAQERTRTSLDVEGGKVTIDYTSTKIGDRSPADIPVGTVWRMSKDAAAGLTTTVPLMTRTTMLAPGSYKLSARRVSKSKWELVIFQGGMLFQDGMAHQTSSLRLDDEDESTEDLTISLKKSKRSSGEQARVKLAWGRHSLNTRFTVIGKTSIEGNLGGKPTVFSFFHIPVGKYQQKLTDGDLLAIGMADQKGAAGVSYSIHAQKRGQNGCDLVFQNVTLTKNPGIIKANRDMQKRMKDFLVQAGDEQATQIKTALEQMAAELETLETQQKAAAGLRERVTVSGSVANAGAASKHLEVDAKSDAKGIRVAMTFGARTATFVVQNGTFKKQR